MLYSAFLRQRHRWIAGAYAKEPLPGLFLVVRENLSTSLTPDTSAVLNKEK